MKICGINLFPENVGLGSKKFKVKKNDICLYKGWCDVYKTTRNKGIGWLALSYIFL